MFECHGCRRYIRESESTCPFCGATPRAEFAPTPSASACGRAILALAFGLSLSACVENHSDGESSSDTGDTTTDTTTNTTTDTTTNTTTDNTTESDSSDDSWEQSADAYTVGGEVTGEEWDTEESDLTDDTAGDTDTAGETDTGSETDSDTGSETDTGGTSTSTSG